MKLCGESYTLPLMLPLHFVLSALIYDILSIIADIKNFDFLRCKKEHLFIIRIQAWDWKDSSLNSSISQEITETTMLISRTG